MTIGRACRRPTLSHGWRLAGRWWIAQDNLAGFTAGQTTLCNSARGCCLSPSHRVFRQPPCRAGHAEP